MSCQGTRKQLHIPAAYTTVLVVMSLVLPWSVYVATNMCLRLIIDRVRHPMGLVKRGVQSESVQTRLQMTWAKSMPVRREGCKRSYILQWHMPQGCGGSIRGTSSGFSPPKLVNHHHLSQASWGLD